MPREAPAETREEAQEPEPTSPDVLTQHWSWRPDWTAERRNLWWYGTVGRDATVRRLAAAARTAIRPGAPVDPVPYRWLHLSLAEVGYAADLPRSFPAECARATRAALADMPAVDLDVGPLRTMAGALALDVRSARLADVYDGIITALASTLGRAPAQRLFDPHVTVAYVRRDGTIDEALDRAALEQQRAKGQDLGSIRLTDIALVEVVRSRRHYRWSTRRRLRLADARAASPEPSTRQLGTV